MFDKKSGQRRTAASVGKPPRALVTGRAVAGEQFGRALALVDIGLSERRRRGQSYE
jgi:hypothetical protein